MAAALQEWEAEVVDLKRQGLDTREIAEALDKHPSTIRKAVARAREAGRLADDRVLSSDEASAAFGAPSAAAPAIRGQTTVDDFTGEVPPEDDPEYEPETPGNDWINAPGRDPLEDFKAEAGEAVGPMPPGPEEDTDPDVVSRVAGTRQMALDFGPEADVPVGGTLVVKSEKRASGHFGMGDVITGTFTARITDIGGKERFDSASEEFRAKPTAYVATITEFTVDGGTD